MKLVILYDVLHYVGYFIIFIIFSIFAIVFAKKKFSWLLYLIGTLITLLSLWGNQKSSLYRDMTPYWGIFVVLLAASLILILKRKYSSPKEKSKKRENSFQGENGDGETWKCTKCGATNPKNSLCCKTCGNYK